METSETKSEIRASVFVIMWALGHMIHLSIHSSGRFADPTQIVVYLVAISACLAPRSERLIILLAVAQIIDWWSFAPLNPDHWTLVMAVNVALVTGKLASWIFFGGSRVSLVEDTIPALRLLLLIAYGAAALAKWNTTFLNPEHSCAAYLFNLATFGMFGGVHAADILAVILTVSAETLTFVLLAIPQGRRLGVRLGLVFHSLVSLSPVMGVADFTATVSALFILFLPRSDIANAVAWLDATNSNSPLLSVIKRNRWVIPLPLLAIGGLLGYRSSIAAAFWLWFAVVLYQVFLVLLPILRVAPISSVSSRLDLDVSVGSVSSTTLYRTWISAAPAVLFIAFTAANPYLGLRTTGAFTMFSNLRTEAGMTNHVLGGSVAGGYQGGQFLRVTDSNIETLSEAAENGESIPIISLHGWTELADSDSYVEGTIGNSSLRWTAATSSELMGEPTFFERYLLSFRPIDLDGPHPRCGN